MRKKAPHTPLTAPKPADEQSTVSSVDFNDDFSIAQERTVAKRRERHILVQDCLNPTLVGAVEDAVFNAIETPVSKAKRPTQFDAGNLPESIGEYSISEFVGNGSFGAVYRGIHPRLLSNVAVKISLDPLFNDEARERFFNEATIANKLIHRNIVRAITADQLDDGRCFIVFDFVEGQDLKSYLKSNSITNEQTVDMFVQILDGIKFAHASGVVHRDIKPSNILISRAGIPQISDFGVALLSHHLESGRDIAGTIRYMAPEQIEGEIQNIDARADIFALGLVLAEMLTGQSVRRDATAAKHETDVGLLFDNTNVHKELVRICKKCCAFDPQFRYPSARELSNDIQQWRTAHERSKRLASLDANELNVGLRPYNRDQHATYVRLISDELNQLELPEPINFWKSRIERQGSEPTFRIGVLSGQCSTGKTSLIQSGLIPSIETTTTVEYCDCRNYDDLADAVNGVLKNEQQESLASCDGTKRLFIFDHLMMDTQDFEADQNQSRRNQIVETLARSVHSTAQILFVANDTEKPRLAKLLASVGVTLDPLDNYLALPAPQPRDIKSLLIRLGSAAGLFPDGVISPANHQFIDSAIEQMGESGAIDYATAQVFFDTAKDVDWVPSSFQKIGSVMNWRYQYVARSLYTHDSFVNRISRVLGAFLQSDKQPHTEMHVLVESVLGDDEKLDIESALVHPSGLFTEREGANTESAGDQKCFLRQSYLRPAIAAFCQNIAGSKSWSGRHMLNLQRDAGLWAGNPKTPVRTFNVVKQLISGLRRKKTKLESRYLRVAIRKVAIRAMVCATLLAAMACLASFGITKYRTTRIVQSTPDRILQYRHSVNSLGLSSSLASTMTDPEQSLSAVLNAAFVYSQFNECPVDFLVDVSGKVPYEYQEVIATTFELSSDRAKTRDALERKLTTLSRDADLEKRLRVCLFLARLNAPEHLRQVIGIDSTPDDRTRSIAALSKWIGCSMILRTCEILEDDAGIVSALLNSMTPDSKDEPTETLTADQANQIERLYALHPSGAVRMAARRWINKFELTDALSSSSPNFVFQSQLQPINRYVATETEPQDWFVNSLGQTMIELPRKARGGRKVYMNALEFSCDEFGQLMSSISEGRELEEALRFVSEAPRSFRDGYPINSVLEASAFEICNLLSEREGRGKCYKRIGYTLGKIQSRGYIRGVYEFDFSQNGYRLPFASEWQGTVMFDEKLSYLGDHTDRERITLFENMQIYLLEKSGSRLPSRFGFCDLAGNSYELVHDVETHDVLLTNGTVGSIVPDAFKPRTFNSGMRGAPFVSLRICCSE